MVENGYIEVVPGTGSLLTKDKFADFQLHIEWAAPAVVSGSGQNRGNSGIIVNGMYELQVLDSIDKTVGATWGVEGPEEFFKSDFSIAIT